MAYNGNSSKIVSSSFLYSTLQSFYTKIKGLLDNKITNNPFTGSGISGTSGYIAFAQLVITSSYTNRPIEFELVCRGRATPCYVSILFSNGDTKDPTLSSLSYFGADYGVFAQKTDTSTWLLYHKKTESYDNLTVTKIQAAQQGINITYPGSLITEKPTENVTDAVLGYRVGYATSSESATKSTKATTLDGLTSTVAELNYCDGVTSNIQTQLDAKAASSHTHSYVPLSGSTSITGTLRTSGELQSTSANAIRMVSGGYGTMLRNDGSSTYLLLTNKDDPYGGWNDLRPLAINNSTGVVKCSNGITGNLNGNASSATNADTVDGYHAHEIQTRTVEGGLYDGKNNTAYIQWDGSNYFWLRTPYNSTAVNHSATSDNSGCSYNLNSTGFGSGTLTYLQTSGDFYDNTGWCHYIMANHGDGATYYNHTIALPFWDVPMYQRQHGSTGARTGWQKFYTTENITYGTWALTPGSSGLATGHIYLQYE